MIVSAPATDQFMIQADHLVRWYGPTLAVDDVSFDVTAGQVAALLGPNGAGKSTTLRMLTGCLPPTEGRSRLAGWDVQADALTAKRQLGYLPEHDSVYPELRVEEYLDFRGRLMGMSRADRRRRADEVVDRCGLASLRRRTVGRLSKGNRRRLGLAQALLHEPSVLILDEPTSGFDPTQAAAFRALLGQLKEKHCILLSTHLLPEVEQTADRLLIMAGGKLQAQGTPAELRQQAQRGATIHLRAGCDGEALRQALSPMLQTDELAVAELVRETSGCRVSLEVHEDASLACARIGEALAEHGVAVRELSSRQPSLEELFVRITAGN